MKVLTAQQTVFLGSNHLPTYKLDFWQPLAPWQVKQPSSRFSIHAQVRQLSSKWVMARDDDNLLIGYYGFMDDNLLVNCYVFMVKIIAKIIWFWVGWLLGLLWMVWLLGFLLMNYCKMGFLWFIDFLLMSLWMIMLIGCFAFCLWIYGCWF